MVISKSIPWILDSGYDYFSFSKVCFLCINTNKVHCHVFEKVDLVDCFYIYVLLTFTKVLNNISYLLVPPFNTFVTTLNRICGLNARTSFLNCCGIV